MIENLKALVVVLFFAVPILFLVKPICLRFMTDVDYRRRRNVWLAVTVAAFLSPSIWLYLAIILPIVAWASKRDSNPLALVLFILYAVPQASIAIPVVGIAHLFDLTYIRALTIAILFPIALRNRKRISDNGIRDVKGLDILLLSYCLLQVVLEPFHSATVTLRVMFLLWVDIFLLYYVFSRGFRSHQQIAEAAMMFVLALALFAPLALFEAVRHWLLYEGIYAQWGHITYVPRMIFRGELLRSQLTAGHPLALGFIAALAFGLWLFLGSEIRSKFAYAFGSAWLWMALVGAYSRGPWVSAVAMVFLYVTLTPKAPSRIAKLMVYGSLIGFIAIASPLGPRIVDSMPFIGTIESENVEYREQLLEESLGLIKENPFFGTPDVISRMDHMRQGQGIVDLVNGYLYVALYFGLVTLGAVVFFFLLIGLQCAFCAKAARNRGDLFSSRLGASLIACIGGSLVFVGTAGFEPMMWVLGGLVVGYIRLDSISASDSVCPQKGSR